jgi:ADP-ribose pyrophosphatase YjhB (NUDIX family)
MIISANGIVFNEYGDVLLVQRNDTRTLAPPGGAVEIDELPSRAAAREVREETGLTVHPIRLVGLYFLPTRPVSYLFLCFRCMPGSGELTSSDETISAGYYGTNPLGGRMLAAHKEQIERAFYHKGGPPYWGEVKMGLLIRAGSIILQRIVYPWFRIRRKILNQPAYVAPPYWQVKALIIIKNEEHEILCLSNEQQKNWRLPESAGSGDDSPWSLAHHTLQDVIGSAAKLDDLSGIYLKQAEPLMIFVFKATIDGLLSSVQMPGRFMDPVGVLRLLPADHQAILTNLNEDTGSIAYKILPKE